MHGEVGVNKRSAQEIRDLALASIVSLGKIVSLSRGQCSEKEFHELSKAVGSAIGRIHVEILSSIYSQYPELDDLK
jgi:hypothetical protein